MPRNATGAYSLPEAPFVAGTVISSAAVNDNFSDIATALTGSLARGGQGGMTGQLKLLDGSVGAPALAFNNDLASGFYRPADHSVAIVVDSIVSAIFTPTGITGVTSSVFQPGMVIDYCVDTVPSAFWLFCYGQAVSRTTYAALFAKIGTKFGSGDGTTTFNMPDLRGRTVFGNDNMGGAAAGRLTTTFFGSDPTVTGNVGGVQSKTILTANLPAYTPAGLVTTTVTPSQQVLNMFGGNSVNPPGSIQFAGTNNTGTTFPAVSTFAGTAQGGTSTAFSLINPGLILNKMIFTGS